MTRNILAPVLAAAALVLAAFSISHTNSSLHEMREGQAALARELSALREAVAQQAARVPAPAPGPAPIAAIAPSSPPAPALAEAAMVPSEVASARDVTLARFDDLQGKGREKALEDLAALARWGDAEARDRIVSSLYDTDPGVREEAVKTVAELGDPDLAEELRPLLSDPNADVRKEVADALQETRGPSAGPMLVRLLDDGDPEVVSDAIKALGKIGYRPALGQIADLAMSDNLDVVTAAGISLRRFGDHAAADEALDRAARGVDSPDPSERKDAVKRVRKIGGDAARSYLEGALEDEDYAVQKEARKGLGELP